MKNDRANMQIMLRITKTKPKKAARHQIRRNNLSAEGLETRVMMVETLCRRKNSQK
ncbi:hypothetical protein OAN307_c39970 [Octadecabacter antarcticus 307]|uniref:Uncharacterized protein n=1 Tax=Octadecabacter antarcticus 307 TaxID=391626 RepID=M9R9V5_9RHOB|nr:hypothetical protein OAN307_c39970 [Octadecabacter antarcticus 307]